MARCVHVESALLTSPIMFEVANRKPSDLRGPFCPMAGKLRHNVALEALIPRIMRGYIVDEAVKWTLQVYE